MSPPQSGDEVKGVKGRERLEEREQHKEQRRSKLFMKDKGGGFSVSMKQSKSSNVNKVRHSHFLRISTN